MKTLKLLVLDFFFFCHQLLMLDSEDTYVGDGNTQI